MTDRRCVRGRWISASLLSLIMSQAAAANEDVVYVYDALGRLKQVTRSGSINNGVQATYTYDAAGNRVQVVVTTGTTPPPPPPPPPPPAPSFTISDASAVEGGQLSFTVTKSGSTTSSFSVNFATANGSAAAGSDFVAQSGTLTFAPSDASRVVVISTVNDSLYEVTETMSVNLAGATGGASISKGQGIGTITDNDADSTTLLAGQSMSSQDGRFVLSMQTDGNLVLYGPAGAMWWTSTNGGSDRRMVMQADGNLVVYNSANQALWSSATYGNPGARLVVQNDGNLVIYNTANQGVWASNTVYQAPSFSVSDAYVQEGGYLAFTVTRSGPSGGAFTMSYAAANGSAVAGADFNAASGTLTFGAGETSKVIYVSTVADGVYEGLETLTMTLSNLSGGAQLSRGQGTGSIDDEPPPPPPEECWVGGQRQICDIQPL